MSTKYIVNNASGQTINGQSLLPSYKVYTALLTQSGGTGNAFIGPGELTIGVTYMINDSFLGQDFTNVGAPNNDVGTWFVATGTIPNSWGENPENNLIYYPGAPVVTVLENTIGNIWFTYVSTGTYDVKSNNLFIDNKTTFSINLMGQDIGTGYFCLGDILDESTNRITTGSPDVGEINDVLTYKTPIEIRVYN